MGMAAAPFSPVRALLVMLIGMMGGVGLPLGAPPLPADPVAANLAPEKCLVYLSSAGMGTADGKSGNQTEQLLAEPEVRQMAAELRRAITAGLAQAMKKQDVPETISAEKVVDLAMVPLTKPLALYVSSFEIQPEGPAIRGGLMMNLGDDAAKTEAALAQVLKQLLPAPAESVEIEGRKWQRLRLPLGPVVWGCKDNRLWIGVGEGEIEAMLKRASGKPPAWLTKLHEDLPIERVSTVAYVNLKAVLPLAGPEVAETVTALGLGNVTSIRSVAGLDKDGFIKKALVTVEGQPEGILRLADAKPLTAADLAVIPQDATVAAAFKFDPEAAWNIVQEIVGKINPGMKAAMEAAVGQMEQSTGLKLREQLLAPLGDTWRVFDSPGDGGAVLGLTAVVSLKDAKQAAATQEKLLSLLRAALKDYENRAAKGEDEGFGLARLVRTTRKLDDLEFAGQHIYIYDESGLFTPPVSPSWCLTDKELILALYPQSIKGYLARGADFHSLNGLPAVDEALRGEPGPVKIAYFNAPRMFDIVYPMSLVWAKYAGAMFGQSGVQLSPAFLPSARAIRPHVRSTGDVRAADAGGHRNHRAGDDPRRGRGGTGAGGDSLFDGVPSQAPGGRQVRGGKAGRRREPARAEGAAASHPPQHPITADLRRDCRSGILPLHAGSKYDGPASPTRQDAAST